MIIARSLSESETDLLIGLENEPLTIRDLNGDVKSVIVAPENGWTHATLESVQYNNLSPDGWDAYLAKIWIGSSEC